MEPLPGCDRAVQVPLQEGHAGRAQARTVPPGPGPGRRPRGRVAATRAPGRSRARERPRTPVPVQRSRALPPSGRAAQGGLQHQLGLGARHQGAGVNLEGPAEELLSPQEIRSRLPLAAAADQLAVGLELRIAERLVEVEVEADAGRSRARGRAAAPRVSRGESMPFCVNQPCVQVRSLSGGPGLGRGAQARFSRAASFKAWAA